MLNEIIRVDLHIHSKKSEYKEEGEIVKNSNFDNIKTLLKKLEENKINLFCFADHNGLDADLFIKTKQIISDKETLYPNIKNILPAVEFDVKFDNKCGACHVIAVFDDEKGEKVKEIESLLNIKTKNFTQKSYFEFSEFSQILSEIGLSVVLIAHQKEDPQNSNVKNKNKSYFNSFCNKESADYFIKAGFISALEFKNSNVEGMIKNSFSSWEYKRQIPLISGSDCHKWENYPHHRVSNKNLEREKWFFEAKALPTFLGLVLSFTSPLTRLNVPKLSDDKKIKYFEWKNKKISLSSGINAIIGENGAGKSSLLHAFLSTKEKSNRHDYKAVICKSHKFKKEEFDDKEINIKLTKQADISELSNSGELIKKVGINLSIDHSYFEKKVKEYANSLKEYIDNNITNKNKLDLLKKTEIDFNDLKNKKIYFIKVVNDISESEINFNKYEESRKNLTIALDILEKEINKKNIYKEHKEQERILTSAKNEIEKLFSFINYEWKKREQKKNLYSIISLAIKEYIIRIQQKITHGDKKILQSEKKREKFIKTIVDAAKISEEIQPDPNLLEMGDNGKAKFSELNGFIFVKKAKYYNLNLEDDFYDNVFTKKFKNKDSLSKINSEKIFEDAIGKGKDFNEKIDKYIENHLKNYDEIIMSSDEKKSNGKTLGQRAIIYYKYLSTQEKFDIFLIDQPEDHISNSQISEWLVEYFNNIRIENRQLIFVTHNPLLVVNQDVDNVIYLENENDEIKIESGCLESGNILKIISEKMDGGREAVQSRTKLYNTLIKNGEK